MKTIERTDAEALSWPVGSQHEIDGEMFIVTAAHHGHGARVHLAEREEWLLRSCVNPWTTVRLGAQIISPEWCRACKARRANNRRVRQEVIARVKRLFDFTIYNRDDPVPHLPDGTYRGRRKVDRTK